MFKHVKGDIFESDADIIIHQVNCQGVMGGGVAKQVREKYPIVYKKYKAWCEDPRLKGNLLGKIQSINSDNPQKQIIVNMFSQDKYGSAFDCSGKCYTDYNALQKCLEAVNRVYIGRTVAVPYLLGCCRGGGDWSIVSKMLEETLCDCDVTLYEYNE